MLFSLHLLLYLALFQQSTSQASDRDFAKGVELQRQGELQAARIAYRSALLASPRRIDALSNLGLVYGLLGEYDLAVGTFRKALAIAPEQPMVRFNLGLTYLQAGQYQNARQEFSLLRASHPNDLNVRRMLGLADLKTSNFVDGVAEIESVWKLKPEDAELTCTLASAYIAMKRIDEAKTLVEGPLSHFDLAEAHLVTGSYYLASQQYPKALEHLTRAHQLSPDLPDLKSTLAAAYAYNADPDLAARLFAEELQRNPRDYTANLLLGWLLLEADRNGDAAKYLNRAREMRPGDPDLLFQLARLARAEERYQDAAGMLEQVIGAKPGYRPAHVLLAQTYRKLKRASDSAREQEIVNRLNQDEMMQPSAPKAR